jgi:hypothetical protein
MVVQVPLGQGARLLRRPQPGATGERFIGGRCCRLLNVYAHVIERDAMKHAQAVLWKYPWPIEPDSLRLSGEAKPAHGLGGAAVLIGQENGPQ